MGCSRTLTGTVFMSQLWNGIKWSVPCSVHTQDALHYSERNHRTSECGVRGGCATHDCSSRREQPGTADDRRTGETGLMYRWFIITFPLIPLCSWSLRKS